ncbi:MAG TPA: hypothetical protein VEC36_09270 [Patescibacteria group bacterium]|nr:hypothetical protein [Patescibacteria group bacterium]
MQKVAKVFKSHAEQEREEIEYWKSVSPLEKLAQLEVIRTMYAEFMGYDLTQGLQSLSNYSTIIRRNISLSVDTQWHFIVVHDLPKILISG